MSNRTRIVLLVAVAIGLIGFLLYQFARNYFPKYRWDTNYLIESDQPYGLKFLYDVLSSSRSKQDFEVLKKAPKYALNETDSNSLYIFIGYKFYIDSVSSRKLIDFVNRGNHAFISSVASTHQIFRYLTNHQRPFVENKAILDSLITVSFDSSSTNYIFEHKVLKKREPFEWLGCDSVYIADTLSDYGFESVSYLNNYYADCFRIKHGKGWFIFHFNPILLTNYTLTGKQGYSYFSRLLDPYNKKKIYWDEFSKIPASVENGEGGKQSPLRFILSERSLKWNWYLIWIFVLIFIIVNSKRKQALMPILPINRNTTVEYLNSISKLHYNSSSLAYLADEILKQLLIFIKQKYDISPELKKHEIARLLAPKSGIDEEKLNKMFKHHMNVKYSPVKETEELIEFYKLTEYFYKNCK